MKAIGHNDEEVVGTYFIDTSTQTISVSESLFKVDPYLVWEDNGEEIPKEDTSDTVNESVEDSTLTGIEGSQTGAE